MILLSVEKSLRWNFSLAIKCVRQTGLEWSSTKVRSGQRGLSPFWNRTKPEDSKFYGARIYAAGGLTYMMHVLRHRVETVQQHGKENTFSSAKEVQRCWHNPATAVAF